MLRARTADTYGTAEAARLLGLSDRRVRQLVVEGQLPGERDAAGVLRLRQEAVHEERSRRRTPEGPLVDPGRKPTTAATDPEVIAAAVGEVLAGQRELTAQAHSLLDAERARFEAELLELRARLAAQDSEEPPAAPPAPAPQEPPPRGRNMALSTLSRAPSTWCSNKSTNRVSSIHLLGAITQSRATI